MRPSGPIVVGPERQREVLWSRIGVPTKVPDSWRGGLAANGVEGAKHIAHHWSSGGRAAPQERQRWPIGMS
jgi:hypothetical protein